MNVSDPGASRPQYYDRNPLDVAASSLLQNQAPSVYVVQITYTVPANRKAYLENGQLYAIRVTAAAAVALWRSVLRLTPSGGAARALRSADSIGNNVADRADQAYAGAGLMLTGDVLDAGFTDTSTGGTVTYWQSFKLTEFDA